MSKITRVSDLKKGVATIRGSLSYKEEMTKPKNGQPSPFLRASIDDNSNKFYTMIWSSSDMFEKMKEFQNGDYIEAEILVEKEADAKNIYISGSIKSMKKIEPVGIKGVVDVEKLRNELREEVASIENENINKLITNVLSRSDIRGVYFTAPATEKSGYSHEGGVLAHMVRLIRLSKAFANIYNEWENNIDGYKVKLNIDLLKACAILHDIGKLKAYKFNGSKVVKTKEGELFEDSYLGAKILIEELPKVELLEEERLLLEHAVTSSKDKLAFGSLNSARTAEAIAFHNIEKLDGQMANFEYLFRTALSGDEFVKLFDKVLYLGLFEEV